MIDQMKEEIAKLFKSNCYDELGTVKVRSIILNPE